jgi:hypothetical protein
MGEVFNMTWEEVVAQKFEENEPKLVSIERV